jgi:hypothetical protein
VARFDGKGCPNDHKSGARAAHGIGQVCIAVQHPARCRTMPPHVKHAASMPVLHLPTPPPLRLTHLLTLLPAIAPEWCSHAASSLPVSLPASHPPFLPPSLPASLPACLPACLRSTLFDWRRRRARRRWRARARAGEGGGADASPSPAATQELCVTIPSLSKGLGFTLAKGSDAEGDAGGDAEAPKGSTGAGTGAGTGSGDEVPPTLRIQTLKPGGAAEDAGLLAGDIILQVNGRGVRSFRLELLCGPSRGRRWGRRR